MIDTLRLVVTDRSTSSFRWRLVSGNGRAVAVSAVGFDAHAGATASFVALCLRPETLAMVIVHPSSSVAWSWNLVDETGAAVASSERIYDRYGTCIAACRRFLATLGELGSSGARRLAGSQ